MVRAPADVGDALGVTGELSETAGDHHTLSFTLALGWGSQIANCHHSIPSVLQLYWIDYLPISWCLHCVLVFVKLLITFSISVCYVCSALWLSHRVSTSQLSIIIIIITKISIIIISIIIIIICVMFVQHFEPWGKRFTHFHYYYHQNVCCKRCHTPCIACMLGEWVWSVTKLCCYVIRATVCLHLIV